MKIAYFEVVYLKKRELAEMGNRMKNKRRMLGYTQEQIAELADLSYSAYTKIENAIQSPSLDALIRIAAVLHESMDGLLFGKEAEKKEIPNDELFAVISNLDSGKLEYVSRVLAQLAQNLKK